jgi:hypothetical protein
MDSDAKPDRALVRFPDLSGGRWSRGRFASPVKECASFCPVDREEKNFRRYGRFRFFNNVKFEARLVNLLYLKVSC